MVKQLPDVNISEPKPADHRLAWWLENSMVRIVKRVFNSIGGNVRQLLSFSISDTFESFEQELIPIVRPLLSTLIDNPRIPSWFKSPIEKALAGTSPISLVILALVVPIAAAALSRGVEGPIGRMIEYAIDNVVRSRLFDPGTAILMWQRGILGETEVNRVLNQNGITNAGIVSLKRLAEVLIPDDLLTQGYWRKDIHPTRIGEILKARGLSEEHINLWYKAREVIPPPSQLVSMAVREAFNDDVAKHFGYDEDFPWDASAWAEKTGMSYEWFRRAWRAHWTLPGLTQVREMFHREIIRIDDVRAYLKAADIPRFWRENIILWMYKEVTRVDVRRIFSLGLISPEDVYKRYLKLGYDEDDASLMTQWTVAEYSEKSRELTKSDILTMYESNVLNETETDTYLTALGYQADDIILMMTHRDLKRQEKYEGLVMGYTKKLFVAGVYNATDVYAELGKLDTPGHYIEETLVVWRLEKKGKIRIPSITQLRDMHDADAITLATFRAELANKGYNEKYVQWFVDMWFKEE